MIEFRHLFLGLCLCKMNLSTPTQLYRSTHSSSLYSLLSSRKSKGTSVQATSSASLGSLPGALAKASQIFCSSSPSPPPKTKTPSQRSLTSFGAHTRGIGTNALQAPAWASSMACNAADESAGIPMAAAVTAATVEVCSAVELATVTVEEGFISNF